MLIDTHKLAAALNGHPDALREIVQSINEVDDGLVDTRPVVLPLDVVRKLVDGDQAVRDEVKSELPPPPLVHTYYVLHRVTVTTPDEFPYADGHGLPADRDHHLDIQTDFDHEVEIVSIGEYHVVVDQLDQEAGRR